MDLQVAFLVNSCQRKDAVLSFIQTKPLNPSTHWALDVIQLIVGTIFNLAKVSTVPCMCAAALSLFRTASRRLDSLAYIESITDAYSQ